MNKLDTKRYSCDAPEQALERDVQVSILPENSSASFFSIFYGLISGSEISDDLDWCIFISC